MGGKLGSRENPLRQIDTYGYDGAKRLVAEVNPLGERTTFGYSANGTRVSLMNSLGHITTNIYVAVRNVVVVVDWILSVLR